MGKRANRDGDRELAPLGSLSPLAAYEVRLLIEYAEGRAQALRGLFGRSVKANPIRDDLIRSIVWCFANDRIEPTAFYVRKLQNTAAASTIRLQLVSLQQFGLVVLDQNPADRRVYFVRPTNKLIMWYNRTMPQLLREALKHFPAMLLL